MQDLRLFEGEDGVVPGLLRREQLIDEQNVAGQRAHQRDDQQKQDQPDFLPDAEPIPPTLMRIPHWHLTAN